MSTNALILQRLDQLHAGQEKNHIDHTTLYTNFENIKCAVAVNSAEIKQIENILTNGLAEKVAKHINKSYVVEAKKASALKTLKVVLYTILAIIGVFAPDVGNQIGEFISPFIK